MEANQNTSSHSVSTSTFSQSNATDASKPKIHVTVDCGHGYNPEVWKNFVNMEVKPTVIAACAKNAENRKKNKICHTLGRCSYANKSYTIDGTSVKVVLEDRANRWLRGHEQSDGSVHPSTVEKYDQIKVAREKRKMSGHGSSSQLDLDSDVLVEVFGPNVKGESVPMPPMCQKSAPNKQLLHPQSLIERMMIPCEQQ